MNNTPIPNGAYASPSPDEVASNTDYWSGYSIGRTVTPPSPANTKDYASYRKSVDVMLKPASLYGWINSVSVGYNEAIIDGANYLYLHDPDSPHNKVI